MREIVLPAAPEAVWESLTRPEELSSWLGSRVELDLRPGGELRMESGEGVRFGVVEAVTAFERIAFRWRPLIAGLGGPVLGPATRVEFVLRPERNGSRLRVEETAPLSATGSGQGDLRAMGGSSARAMARAASAGGPR